MPPTLSDLTALGQRTRSSRPGTDEKHSGDPGKTRSTTTATGRAVSAAAAGVFAVH